MFDYIQLKDELDTNHWKSKSWLKFRITHTTNPSNDEFLNYQEVCERATIQVKEEAFKAQLDAVLKS